MQTDADHGKDLGLRFLKMCEDDGASGVALLNAIGNALVGFFNMTKFPSHKARMEEVDQWCAELRKEVDAAHARAN